MKMNEPSIKMLLIYFHHTIKLLLLPLFVFMLSGLHRLQYILSHSLNLIYIFYLQYSACAILYIGNNEQVNL